MKKSNNIISDWLRKYRNPEIDKQVEREIEHINKVEMLKSKIKEYCKTHKLKFEKYIEGGFDDFTVDKLCDLSIVSQRSELLFTLLEWIDYGDGEGRENIVDRFLKDFEANNCG